MLARRTPSHVLTLLGPEADVPVCEKVRHQILRFNDITAPLEGYIAPSMEIVRAIRRS